MTYNAPCMVGTLILIWLGLVASSLLKRRVSPPSDRSRMASKGVRVVLTLTMAVAVGLFLDEDLRKSADLYVPGIEQWVLQFLR